MLSALHLLVTFHMHCTRIICLSVLYPSAQSPCPQFCALSKLELLVCSRLSASPEEELEEGLLRGGPRDVEHGDQKRERSWYSLIGTALRHVWPHSLAMQARVVACLLIITAQRFVNLAVPILCEPPPPPPTQGRARRLLMCG